MCVCECAHEGISRISFVVFLWADSSKMGQQVSACMRVCVCVKQRGEKEGIQKKKNGLHKIERGDLTGKKTGLYTL
jgi:hypothetical protein